MSGGPPIDVTQFIRFLDEDASTLLHRYFASGEFTGGCFDCFGGGGDHPDTANRFTADDVTASPPHSCSR